MLFKPADNPKCPKCGKLVYILICLYILTLLGGVYAAEERVAGGLTWQKMCFNCGLCQKNPNSTICTEDVNEQFCKMCNTPKFNPRKTPATT